jgi:hypothetical protein
VAHIRCGLFLSINIRMAILTPKLYDLISTPKTRQYIETGTYHGDGINRVMDQYERIHSIELAEKYAMTAAEKFLSHAHVTVYHGNSKEVLPILLETISEPVTIFLDGHFSGGETAIGDELVDGVSSAPLLTEIEIIMRRPWDDIVIIDDTRMFGKRTWMNPGNKGGKWPEYEYDWTAINDESIRALLKPGYDIFKNQGREYTNGPNLDQWILARARSL